MDPHWFNADRDTNTDPVYFNCGSESSSRSRVLITKILENIYSWKFFFHTWVSFYQKLQLTYTGTYSLGLPKGCSSYKRSLQPSKENIQYFKTSKFFPFFLFLWVIFEMRIRIQIQQLKFTADPCGSGSGTLVFNSVANQDLHPHGSASFARSEGTCAQCAVCIQRSFWSDLSIKKQSDYRKIAQDID